jgi:hypothetical protein
LILEIHQTADLFAREIQNEGGVRTSQFSSRFIFPHVGQSLAKSKLWRNVKHTEIDI